MMSLIKRKLSHKARFKGNIILLTLLVIMAFNLPLAEATEGPIAEYHFDGNAQDSSGNGNHGTEFGNPTFVQGIDGQALNFDGIDDYIEVPHSTSLDLNVFTVEVWFKSTYSPGGWFRTIVAKYGTESSSLMYPSWGLGWIDSNKLGFYIRTSDNVRNVVSSPLNEGLDGEWHHLVGVASSDKVQFWMDGEKKEEISRTAIEIKNDKPVTMGMHFNAYIPETIAEVRIYDRALSAEEISQQYNFPVENAAPVVDAGPDATINEGETFSSSGSFSDPGSDSWTATVDYGDGSGVQTLTLSGEDFALSHTYADNGDYTVTVNVTDNNGDAGTDTATVTVNNVAPTLTATGTTIDENGITTVSGTITDPGTLDTFTAVIDWGEGTPETFTYPAGTNTYSETHQYLDDNPTGTPSDDYTVSVTLTDDDTGSNSETATVTVNNVAPIIIKPLTGPIEPLPVGSLASVTASFTDAGTEDTHTCTFSWDDGQNPDVIDSDGSGSCTGTQTFDTAGVYTVSVTVTDDDGESATSTYEFVVIYDPSAGFVTGGGWINSPPGAYVDDPTLAGKANFGFVSKYKKGADIPTGETQFQFKAGDLNFHSTVYEWLVVAGAKAQYKGSGTINGAGNYGFLLTATDSQIPGGGDVDKFRIKIVNKDTDEIVYDNKFGESDDMDTTDPQEIGGGNIVIHKAK